jgi:mycothiol system anti-sigma-R factor
MTLHASDDIPCEAVIRSVWDYLDGEIDGDRKERIRRHLERCDHCRDQYTFEGAFLRSVARLIDDDSETSALRSRIESALLEHGFPKPA